MYQNNEPPKIVFEGEEFQHSTRSFQTPTPKIVGWVIKYSGGYIKDERQANYVLIGFVVVVITISLFLVFNPLSGGNYPKLDSTAFNKLMQTPPAEIPSITR